ncbi:MAG: hypothetical protein H6945_13465 [Zoogloeaceae bacterium]|nr:hypothetical protein [Rhodocyclaceae bacterium]MCP5236735.1 hypothetical protein [Zoogloeaceae bacterium]
MSDESIPGVFKVVRPFRLAGEVVKAGRKVELDDPFLIVELASNGKIEPADMQTRRRLRLPGVIWTRADPDDPMKPARKPGVGRM